jgi:hypothetical protein
MGSLAATVPQRHSLTPVTVMFSCYSGRIKLQEHISEDDMIRAAFETK